MKSKKENIVVNGKELGHELGTLLYLLTKISEELKKAKVASPNVQELLNGALARLKSKIEEITKQVIANKKNDLPLTISTQEETEGKQ